MTTLLEACARALIQARDTNRNFRLNPPYGDEMEAAKYEARAVIPVVLEKAAEVAEQNRTDDGSMWDRAATRIGKEILALEPETQS